ncbi:MAG: glycosyltransferase family 39 protein [Elusimicrobia bacterium]|nr:glycosyltransferase family 39 protein [Elusimicrobiota bacterium]
MDRIFNWVKRERNYVFLLLFAGLVIRIFYVWLAGGVLPWTDMQRYDEARLAILHGQKYAADWPPLYPLFLAAVSFLFGESHLPLYIAQAVLSALTCLFIYLIADRTFGKTAGLLSLVISCFYVDMVWYPAVLLAETLGLLLLCAVVYLLLDRRSPVLAGILFGLTCLTKGVYLITFPGLLLWLMLRPGKKEAAAAVLKFTAFTFLTIAPWTVRNYYEYKGFVLLAPQDGPSIFLGHNPSATGGADFFFVNKDYGKWFTDDSISVVEKGRIAKKMALEYALSHPLREAQLFFLKLSKYWSLRTHFDINNGPYPLKTPFFFLSIITHIFLFPACFLGAVFSLKDKNAFISTIIISVNTLAFTTLFFASGRMRYQLAPFIIILASYGLRILPEIAGKLRGPAAGGISKKLAAAAALTFLLYANFIYQVIEKHKDIANRFQ